MVAFLSGSEPKVSDQSRLTASEPRRKGRQIHYKRIQLSSRQSIQLTDSSSCFFVGSERSQSGLEYGVD